MPQHWHVAYNSHTWEKTLVLQQSRAFLMLSNSGSPGDVQSGGWGWLLPSLKDFFSFKRSFFSSHLNGMPVPTLTWEPSWSEDLTWARCFPWKASALSPSELRTSFILLDPTHLVSAVVHTPQRLPQQQWAQSWVTCHTWVPTAAMHPSLFPVPLVPWRRDFPLLTSLGVNSTGLSLLSLRCSFHTPP